MNTEKTYSPISGYVMLAIILVCLFIGIGGFVAARVPFFISAGNWKYFANAGVFLR